MKPRGTGDVDAVIEGTGQASDTIQEKDNGSQYQEAATSSIADNLTLTLQSPDPVLMTRTEDAWTTSLPLATLSTASSVGSLGILDKVLEVDLVKVVDEEISPPLDTAGCYSFNPCQLSCRDMNRLSSTLGYHPSEYEQIGDQSEATGETQEDEQSNMKSTTGMERWKQPELKHKRKESSGGDHVKLTFGIVSNNDPDDAQLLDKMAKTKMQQESNNQDKFSDGGAQIRNKEAEERTSKTILLRKIQDEKSERNTKTADKEMETKTSINDEIILSQRCMKIKYGKLDLPTSEKARFITLSKTVKVDNNFYCTQYSESKDRNDLCYEDKTQNQSEIDQILLDNPRMKSLRPAKKRFWLKLGDGDKIQVTTRHAGDDLNMSLGSERMMLQDGRRALQLLMDSLGTSTNVDQFLVKADVMNEEGFYTSVNNCRSLCRKRATGMLSSDEDIIPAKVGRLESSGVIGTNDIWSKMEWLCDETHNGREATGSIGGGRETHAQNRFSSQFKEDGRLESEPGSGKFLLQQICLKPESFLGSHTVSQPKRFIGGYRRNKVTSRAPKTGYSCKKESVFLKTDHKSRRNSSHIQRPNSSLDRLSRSHSAESTDSCCSNDTVYSHDWLSQSCASSHTHYRHHRSRSTSRHHREHTYSSRSSSGQSVISRSSYSSSLSRSPSQARDQSLNSDGLRAIKELFIPLVLPASVTTLIIAPVTGSGAKGIGGVNKGGGPNENASVREEGLPRAASGHLQNDQNDNIGPTGDKRESKEAVEATSSRSAPIPSSSTTSSAGSTSKPLSGYPGYRHKPVASTLDRAPEDNFDHSGHRYQPGYDQVGYNHMSYHSASDPYFSEDTGYENFETDDGDYDQFYDDSQDDYGYGYDSYHHPPQRPPGSNAHYSRRPVPQGFRGPPPQMFAANGPSFGPPRQGMGSLHRMGPNGPVGARGPRQPLGPRGGHRPQIGPGGSMGPPGMRGPSRGSPYGPPRPMRPQGMRGHPGSGMMGQSGQVGPGGPFPRAGPPRMTSPMPRPNPQAPSGPRPRMGSPVSSPLPRDGQYAPPRPGMLPHNLMLNLSQPPPNFNPPSSALPPPSLATSSAGTNVKTSETVEPPPLPPPKPPTPKPPPPLKEEAKKEEIKPMTPLIPPEQAEQYRRLREQARKHARKQLRKQEHRAKGEPESSDDDDEEKAKRKEYEAKLAAEREDMEKAALLAAQDDGGVEYDDGATIYLPASQHGLMQQPTYVIQHHPMTTQPSPYGLVSAPQYVHAAHPAMHASQLQNLQFMTSAASQPQLVQLPNGQVAYASLAPMAYQSMPPMVSMSPQGVSASSGVPHQMVLSPGGVHQVPYGTHPGIAVSSGHYMSHYMAAQAAQIQAAQAAQAAQIQAAQAAQAQQAQVQAAQAQQAQVQAAQAQQAQLHGFVPGVHMNQHVMPAIHPQGQYILVPRVARPQI